MIYFDKRNLNLLKIIYRSKDGITFDAISKKVLPPELYEKEKKDGAEVGNGLFPQSSPCLL